MAASNMLLFRFRFDDSMIVDMLSDYSKGKLMAGSHAAVLMAAQPAAGLAAYGETTWRPKEKRGLRCGRGPARRRARPLGARLQVLETETSLSRERLLRLYKEVRGESPPKGMLPFSTDWFMSWMPNIHASIFINIHGYLVATPAGIQAALLAYKLYLEHVQIHELEQALSFTRAWSLLRFFDAKLLDTAPCKTCGGNSSCTRWTSQKLRVRPVQRALARRQDPQSDGSRAAAARRRDAIAASIPGSRRSPTGHLLPRSILTRQHFRRRKAH